jgi:hypothetical protein
MGAAPVQDNGRATLLHSLHFHENAQKVVAFGL